MLDVHFDTCHFSIKYKEFSYLSCIVTILSVGQSILARAGFEPSQVELELELDSDKPETSRP